jgi:hypothetical protein
VDFFEAVFSLLGLEEGVLDEDHSALMVVEGLDVVQELLLVLNALLHQRSHQVLHGLPHFGFEHQFVRLLVPHLHVEVL